MPAAVVAERGVVRGHPREKRFEAAVERDRNAVESRVEFADVARVVLPVVDFHRRRVNARSQRVRRETEGGERKRFRTEGGDRGRLAFRLIGSASHPRSEHQTRTRRAGDF